MSYVDPVTLFSHGDRERWLCREHGSIAGVLGARRTGYTDGERACDMCIELSKLDADDEVVPVEEPPLVAGGQGRGDDDPLAAATAIYLAVLATLVVGAACWLAVLAWRSFQ